ncbi:phospholipid scramblase 1-like isoform X3 [Oncorhynchus kisutch]|uniref:phospholipid scramblase 1-like isoform X3 n=1 Tax=Oncorhynchus kisutch TaxID=8019 RepID=UPI0012DED70F|nr:phospholipid scramblase 1-like isoform X3 [Oncorhynchus kisutch]
MSAPGYPSPHQGPGSYSTAPYPVPHGGYGDPNHAPPLVDFHMGYNHKQLHPGQPVMHQPVPMPEYGVPQMGPGYGGPMPGPEFGAPHSGPPAAISPAPAAVVPVGVPPGLEYLTQIDQLLIHQKVELLEVFIGFETNNQYEIKNSLGQKIYKAKEKNDCCTRNCCGALRSFDMKIKDNMDREVIRLIRPFRCASCWCPCCLQELTGEDGSKPIGRISKQWGGLIKEVFTDTDNFGIQFPMDLDVKMKAVLMGACFLIDFMFFEKD